MGLNPISDPAVDQNFRYLEKLIKSSQQQKATVVQQTSNKQNVPFSRSWIGDGLVWLLHKLSVLAEPNEGISVSKAGVATVRKPNYGIDCDSAGLLLLVEASKGLALSASGLALKQQAAEADAAAVSAITAGAGADQIDRATFNADLATLASEINGIKTTLNNLLAKLRLAEIINT